MHRLICQMVSVLVLLSPACAQAFNELNPAASGYRLVLNEGWTSPTAATVDWNNTLQFGFSWYLARPYGWPATHASELSFDPNGRNPGQGVLTINPSANYFGWQLASAAPLPGGGYVGTTWGPGRGWYFEAGFKFNDALARAYGGPAIWMEPIDHMMVKDHWEGQPAGYEHFDEIDFFEYQTYPFAGNGSFGSYRHDWYGQNGGRYSEAGYNGYMAIVPSPAPNWTQWHKISALYTPGCDNGSCLGSIQMWFDNVPYQYMNGLGTSIPFTWKGCGIGSPPIAPGPQNTCAYSEIDHDRYAIVLGTAKGTPLQIGYVKMWVPQ